MLNLEKYATNLVEKDGIYFSAGANRISYPESGNDNCFQIEADSFWFNHRNNCIIEAVKKYCPTNCFFDIGGGNGFVAKGLEDSGITSVLLEPGVNGCYNARKRGLKNVICSTMENVDFKKESIPAVGLFDVVEHIKEDVAFLTSVHAILEENGFVFITVPAFKFLWSKEDDYAGHFRRYTCREMEDKLKLIGFEIVYSSYIFSILPLPVFLFRTLPGKLGFNTKPESTDKHKSEHKEKQGIANKILNGIWNMELTKIRKGEKIPVGGSCFVVAKKSALVQ